MLKLLKFHCKFNYLNFLTETLMENSTLYLKVFSCIFITQATTTHIYACILLFSPYLLESNEHIYKNLLMGMIKGYLDSIANVHCRGHLVNRY